MQVERLREIAKRYSRQAAAVVVLASSAAFAACGGKSEGEVRTTPTLPAYSPVATEKNPSPTAIPTIEPTPTLEPIPTPEGLSDKEIAEIAAKILSAENLVITVSDLNPNSEFLTTVRAKAIDAQLQFNEVLKTKNYQSVRAPLEGFGNVGVNIGNYACHNTYGEVEGKAWAEVKDLVLNSSLKFEQLGFLEAGTTQLFKEVFFRVNENCTNPIMLSANN